MAFYFYKYGTVASRSSIRIFSDQEQQTYSYCYAYMYVALIVLISCDFCYTTKIIYYLHPKNYIIIVQLFQTIHL